MHFSSTPNRTLCDVLEDMRKCVKTQNFAPLAGLIEEVQIVGNRMEAGLWDKKDLFSLKDSIKEKKRELKKLRNKVNKLKGE